MKLNYDKKSKDPTYFVQKGYRIGKKTTTKNIARIGKHSELLKITDDPLSYAKEQVRKYNEEEQNNKQISLEVSINFAEKLKANNNLVSRSTSRNVGYFFLQYIYNQLNIRKFFENITADARITFDPNTVNRFLTFSRILNPASKLGTCRQMNLYYEQPDIDYMHIMRTLDIMYEHYDEYMEHLFEYSNQVVKRDTSVCYYDCTNYYFEIESPDDDYVDDVTGEFIKGFRKYGFSKQHQPAPLVEMGLFMDKDGIPLSMCLTSGSDNEQTTVVPLEKKLIKMLNGKQFIYCADAGLGSLDIRKFNSLGGRAFIVTQSVKKLSGPLQDAVFNDSGYKLLSDNTDVSVNALKSFDKKAAENRSLYNDKAYKIITADRAVDIGLYETQHLKNGKTRRVKSKALLPQYIIITFSRKVMEYQRYIRSKQIERARKLLENIDPESYKKGPNDVTRFIKRTSGNAADTFEIDTEAIAKEEMYDGYYAVATNLDDSAKDIIEISSKRYKIEDCFRTMKTNFSARPVFHRKKERITAHFMVCYTALLLFRLLEKKLDMAGEHFTTCNIIETLKNMNVVNLDDVCYMATYDCSRICTALNGITGLQLDRKYYQPKELNKKIKKISNQ